MGNASCRHPMAPIIAGMIDHRRRPPETSLRVVRDGA